MNENQGYSDPYGRSALASQCPQAIFRRRGWIDGVDVLHAGQVVAVIPDVGHFQRKARGERMLQAQGPDSHHRRGEIRRNNVERARRCQSTVRCQQVTPAAVFAGNTGPASVQLTAEALYVKAPVAMLPVPCIVVPFGPRTWLPWEAPRLLTPVRSARPGSPVNMPTWSIS